MYKRLVTKGKKPGSKESMATFFTSAVWVSKLDNWANMLDAERATSMAWNQATTSPLSLAACTSRSAANSGALSDRSSCQPQPHRSRRQTRFPSTLIRT